MAYQSHASVRMTPNETSFAKVLHVIHPADVTRNFCIRKSVDSRLFLDPGIRLHLQTRKSLRVTRASTARAFYRQVLAIRCPLPLFDAGLRHGTIACAWNEGLAKYMLRSFHLADDSATHARK